MRTLFIISLLWLTLPSISQNNKGQILYEEKVDAHRNLPVEMEQFKDRIPQFRTTNKLLFFNRDVSYYVQKLEEQNNNEIQGNRRRWRRGGGIMGGGNDNQKLYRDLTTGETKEEREFFGKKFLIEGNTKVIPWKFTGKQKQVGSYLCQEAIYQDTAQKVVAWFTPMIPVATGPGEYAKLPGMILHVDINDGEKVITAQDIQLNILEDDDIILPKEGEKISQSEFEVLAAEKTEEMEAEWSSRRRDYMRRRNN